MSLASETFLKQSNLTWSSLILLEDSVFCLENILVWLPPSHIFYPMNDRLYLVADIVQSEVIGQAYSDFFAKIAERLTYFTGVSPE